MLSSTYCVSDVVICGACVLSPSSVLVMSDDVMMTSCHVMMTSLSCARWSCDRSHALSCGIDYIILGLIFGCCSGGARYMHNWP